MKLKHRKSTLMVVALLSILCATSLLVLKFIPLKYEESSYHRDVTLTPQETDARWFTVPKGYTVTGTYSTSSSNPVRLTITYQSATTYLTYAIYQEQKASGSFSFKAEENVADNKYYLSIQNPASSGFLGFGVGPTITVSVDFKVTGYTTFL